MIEVRHRNERGHARNSWLDTWHTFSFDTYHDPRYMGFRSLRVINEDRVAPGWGFPKHPHRDMEIITYVLEGSLQHKDSMGNGSLIRPGEVQRMSAGTGVTHSEYNNSMRDELHLLQIWILPETSGLAPSYEQKEFSRDEMRGTLRLIAAREPSESAVKVHQDARLYTSIVDSGRSVRHELAPGRYAWLQMAHGAATLNGLELQAGDGAAISEETGLEIVGQKDNSELLLFDLA
jgi:redox-sensitive bicupin YhaK (pirin superfamily)